ncbi:MAG: MmcQ/YjbR family DNA-binding protein [Chthoniobacterales bacterium]
MTPAEFRRLALRFPEAEESAHMNHPDFRVGGKIFATLGYPDNDHGMIILPVDEQARFVREHPKAFAEAKGAWGKRGSTTVRLDAIDKSTLRSALEIAWRNKAPKDL